MSVRLVAVLFLLLGVGLGLPLVGQASPGMILFTDPEGDAYQYSGEDAFYAVPCVTVADPGLGVPIPNNCQARWENRMQGQGAVAAPAFDIIDASIDASPETLAITMRVASLSASMQEWRDRATLRGANLGLLGVLADRPDCVFAVQWLALVGPAEENVLTVAFVMCDNPSGVVPACAAFCVYPVPAKVTTGTPASIVWSVPRDILPSGTGTPGWNNVTGFANGVSNGGDVLDQIRASTPVASAVWWPMFAGTNLDEGGEGRVTFPPAAMSSTRHLPYAADADLADRGLGRPDLDILEVRLNESKHHLVLEATLAHVDGVPADHEFRFDFALSVSGFQFGIGYRAVGGERSPLLENYGRPHPPPAVVLDVITGSPGIVRATIARDSLPVISAGERLASLYAFQFNESSEENNVGSAVRTQINTFRVWDLGGLLGPYAFQFASAPRALEGLRYPDVPNDVNVAATPELALLSFHQEQFDIAEMRLVPTRHDELLVILDVAGEGNPTIPEGFSGAFRGVAFSTARGNFMVGNYARATTGTNEFFCAPDSLIFASSAADPALFADRWVSIGGRLETSGGRGGISGAAGAQGGSIILYVPTTCLGALSQQLDFEFTAVEGATFLFRNPPGGFANSDAYKLDAVTSNGLVTLSLPGIARPAVSFYLQPFGIENFWDIFGVAIAVGFALVSVLVLLRKRLRMKRYLVELEDLADRAHDEPESYAVQLVVLRKRLYSDMLANRLSEGHFVMVEERLRSSLSGTRINAFGKSFYDLPPALMIRLQSLLADGRFSPQDRRVLGELVATLPIAKASRAAVQEQLQLWADQDMEVARLSRQRRDNRWYRRRVRAQS